MTITKNFILSSKQQFIILLLLAFSLNFNTLFNDYALDDGVVMTGNKYVEKGIKGIPEILSTDLLSGHHTEGDEFSGGRYRPFTLIIFALEYQFFGAIPWISHLINVLLFTLLIALLFKLLQSYVFREQHKYLAFITCLLFAVHPIHCEVIANVKSRDELITYILLIVSLIYIIRYTETPAAWKIIIALICFFLALLTRESAVTFVAAVPLIMYFFFNRSIKNSILFAIPLIVVFAGYMALRYCVIGYTNPASGDIFTSPFLLASASQAFATKVFILLLYLRLLVFPQPLSWEYGYNQIPYIDLYSIEFTLSLLLLSGLLLYSIFTFKKRSLYSFCILYFAVTISLVANFIVDIGAPLAERFLFQPSLAICIALAALYIRMEKSSKVFANGALLIIIFLFSIKTYNRNSVWKDNETLFLTDVVSSPNSLRTNIAALEIYLLKAKSETNLELKREYFKRAVYLSESCLKIYADTPLAQSDLVLAYSGLFGCYNSADLFFKDNNLDPSNPEVIKNMEVLNNAYFKQANEYYEQDMFNAAINSYIKCLKIPYPDSIRINEASLELYILQGNAEANLEVRKEYYKKAVYHGEKLLEKSPNNPFQTMELGSAYLGLGEYFKTAELWLQTYKLIPNDTKVKSRLEYLSDIFNKQGNGFYEQGKIDDAVRYFKKAAELNNTNIEAWYNLGGNYYLQKDKKNGDAAWQNVIILDPNHKFNKNEFSK